MSGQRPTPPWGHTGDLLLAGFTPGDLLELLPRSNWRGERSGVVVEVGARFLQVRLAESGQMVKLVPEAVRKVESVRDPALEAARRALVATRGHGNSTVCEIAAAREALAPIRALVEAWEASGRLDYAALLDLLYASGERRPEAGS